MVEIQSTRHILCKYGILNGDEVQRLQRRISCLETESGFIERKLSRLLEQQRAIRKATAIHKSQLASIRCLPSEILNEIFLWLGVREPEPDTMHPSADPWMYSWRSYRPQHLELLLVCRKWHDIALSSPMLWSRLQVDVAEHKPMPSLRTWLSRSGSCGLDLDIRDYRPQHMQPWDEDGMRVARRLEDMIVEQLSPHITQCLRLSIHSCLPDWGYMRALLPSQTLPFIRLESLCVDAIRIDQTGMVIDFSACPRLHTLKCYCWNPVQFLGEGTAVRTLVVGYERRTVVDLLSRCPFITSCRISLGNSDDSDLPQGTQDISTVRHDHIKELWVDGRVTYDQTVSFLQHLCLPSLQKFLLSMSVPARLWPAVHRELPAAVVLKGILERSRGTLTEFDLDSCYIGETDLMRILSSTPYLTSLRITNDVFSDVFWNALTMEEDIPAGGRTPCLCPELTNLKVQDCGVFSVSAIVKMVISRFSGQTSVCKPLSVLHLTEAFSVIESEVLLHHPEIASCIKAGLDLQSQSRDPIWG